MRPDQKIDYVEFPASDLDAIQTFYGATFGWTFTDYGPDYRAFNDGRLDGGFYRANHQSNADAGAALIVLYASDLEATLDAVTKKGGTIRKNIFSFPGGRRFHFCDPHGNELAVWTEQ